MSLCLYGCHPIRAAGVRRRAKPRLVLQDFDCRSAKAELIQDRRVILQQPEPGNALEIFGHHNRVARHQALTVQAADKPAGLPAADHRTIRAQYKHVRTVAGARDSAGITQIISERFAGGMQE